MKALVPFYTFARRRVALTADATLLALEASGVWLLSGVLAVGLLSGPYSRVWIAAALAFAFLLLNCLVYAFCVRCHHLAERKIPTTRDRRVQGEYRYHFEEKVRFGEYMGATGNISHFDAARQEWQFLMEFGQYAPDEWPPIHDFPPYKK